jgi:hypothetical protein
MNTSPLRSPRLFHPSTAQRLQRQLQPSSGRKISSSRKELKQNKQNHRLDLALQFIALLLDEVTRPETREQLAEALPEGQLLLLVAQHICRACKLKAFDYPKLSRATPNGKHRMRSQNHAQFVSFCNEIGIPTDCVPSMNDVVQKHVDVVVNVLLELQVFYNDHRHDGTQHIVQMNLEEYLTPSKRDSGDAHLLALGGPSPLLLRNNVAQTTGASGLFACLNNENILSPSNERRLQHSIKPVTPSYCSTVVVQASPDAAKTNSAMDNNVALMAKLTRISEKVHEERSSDPGGAEGLNLTPTPSLQNPEAMRHASTVSSVRKRLLDQKDRDLASLKSISNHLRVDNDQKNAALGKYMKRATELQKQHDKARDEINLQARAFEENAKMTSLLKQELIDVRKQLKTTEKANEAQGRQISRLTNEKKDLEATTMDLEVAAVDASKQKNLEHIAETKELNSQITHYKDKYEEVVVAMESTTNIIDSLRKCGVCCVLCVVGLCVAVVWHSVLTSLCVSLSFVDVSLLCYPTIQHRCRSRGTESNHQRLVELVGHRRERERPVLESASRARRGTPTIGTRIEGDTKFFGGSQGRNDEHH